MKYQEIVSTRVTCRSFLGRFPLLPSSLIFLAHIFLSFPPFLRLAPASFLSRTFPAVGFPVKNGIDSRNPTTADFFRCIFGRVALFSCRSSTYRSVSLRQAEIQNSTVLMLDNGGCLVENDNNLGIFVPRQQGLL